MCLFLIFPDPLTLFRAQFHFCDLSRFEEVSVGPQSEIHICIYAEVTDLKWTLHKQVTLQGRRVYPSYFEFSAEKKSEWYSREGNLILSHQAIPSSP